MATGSAEHIDVTTADAFIPETWAKTMLVARQENLVFAPRFWGELAERELKIGDVLHIQGLSNLTAQTKNTSSNAVIVYETITESNTNLTIDTWRYNGIALETFAASIANRDLLAAYAPKQGYAIAEAFDAVLAGLVDNFSQIVGSLNVGLTYDDLIRADQYLNDGNHPQEDRSIVISPAEKGNFLSIDFFINNDYSKVASAKFGNRGSLGMWHQVPVFVTTNVEGSNTVGHDNGFFQKEAVAWGMSMKPTVHREFDIDALARKVVVEQGDGSIETRDTAGVFARGL